MATWAWVKLGKVLDLTNVNPAGRYHTDLQWVEVPVGVMVNVGDSYLSGVFSPRPPLPGPTIAQQAVSLMMGGLHVTSTATPVLNGTYACDPVSQQDITAIETSLNAGKGFPPLGAATLPFPDLAGQFHIFSQADFTNLAAAVRDFVYGCKACIGGASQTLPPNTATIA